LKEKKKRNELYGRFTGSSLFACITGSARTKDIQITARKFLVLSRWSNRSIFKDPFPPALFWDPTIPKKAVGFYVSLKTRVSLHFEERLRVIEVEPNSWIELDVA
jgi:hypothetical protein